MACGHRSRARNGQIASPTAMAAAGLILLLLAVYVLHGRDHRDTATPAITVIYVDSLQSALGSRGVPGAPGPAVRKDANLVGPGLPAPTRRPEPGGTADRRALLPGLTSLMRRPDLRAIELDGPEGGFVYQTGRGWIRLVPGVERQVVADGLASAATSSADRLQPVTEGQLPLSILRRYPPGRFPPDGGAAIEEGAAPLRQVAIDSEGPWILREERTR